MHWDENVDPYVVRNAVCPPMYGDPRGYSAFHAPVPSPAVPDVFDRHRTFRPISRGHGETSRDSSRSCESKRRSQNSSRATSRASIANFD